MPLFYVSQYETHIATYKVEANDKADAIVKVLDGEDAELIDVEYVEINEDRGMLLDADSELAIKLDSRVGMGNIVPSIAEVIEINQTNTGESR